MQEKKDPYQILGVSPSAGEREIRNAYRKLVLKYHPDRNKNSANAAQQFYLIQQAYEKIKLNQSNANHEQTSPKSEFIFFRSVKDPFKIRIILPQNEFVKGPFNINVYSSERRTDIHLKLPPQIELVKRKEPKRLVLDSLKNPSEAWITVFELKSDYSGHFEIGPAWYVQTKVRYMSEKGFINIYRPEDFNKKKKSEKRLNRTILSISLFVMFLILSTLIYNIVMDQVDPERKRRALARDGKEIPDFRLNTGETPYSNYYGENIIDFESAHQIEFIGDPILDQVVFLTELHSGRIVRHNYIRSGDTLIMDRIPDGTYYVKVFFGRDWDVSNRLNDGNLEGGFNIYRKFISFTDKEQILRMQRNSQNDSLAFNSFRITLYKVKGGDASAKKMKEEQFF